MRIYMGIDPGKAGAVAIMLPTGTTVMRLGIAEDVLFDFLSSGELDKKADLFALIEKAQAMPKQGGVSMFTYGKGYGMCLGILKAFGVPYQEVHPMKWKAEFSLLHKDKQASIEMAKKLFPQIADQFTLKKDHGKAEALLIAEYARRRNM